MPKAQLHAIKGEFGVWQVQALNRGKALKALHAFFRAQASREKRLLAKERRADKTNVDIPKGFF
jgi:hypothetical protein